MCDLVQYQRSRVAKIVGQGAHGVAKPVECAGRFCSLGAAGDFAFQVTAGPTNVQSMAQYMVFLKDSFGRWNQAAVVGVSLMVLALCGSLVLAILSRVVLRSGTRW